MEKNNELKVVKVSGWLPQECSYNPNVDIKEVESGLAVNISDALDTGVIKDSTYTEQYNSIDDPDQIIGKVRDKFDAIEASRIIRKYGKKVDLAPAISPSESSSSSSPGESSSSNA